MWWSISQKKAASGTGAGQKGERSLFVLVIVSTRYRSITTLSEQSGWKETISVSQSVLLRSCWVGSHFEQDHSSEQPDNGQADGETLLRLRFDLFKGLKWNNKRRSHCVIRSDLQQNPASIRIRLLQLQTVHREPSTERSDSFIQLGAEI